MKSKIIYAYDCIGSSHNQFRRNKLIALLFLLFAAVLTGCGGGYQPPSNIALDVHWDAKTETLHISGQSDPNDEGVEIHDASTGHLLGKALVNSDGSWSATATVPACEVHVELPSGTATATVVDAPKNCTGSPINSRAATINDVPSGVLVVNNPEPLSTIPNAVILNPPTDMTINAGEALTFSGMAIGTTPTQAVGYYWNFGGAAANSTIQNPGSIIFPRAGTYYITLAVTDNLGIPDPTPAARTITVIDNLLPEANNPIPIILSPTAVNGSVNINVGQSLFFSGVATDTLGSTAFTYEWNFAGAAPNQFGPTPGNILFSRAGNFLVTLNATSSTGARSTTPAVVLVNVGTTTAFNQTPSGIIVTPASDVVVNVGESLVFTASGRDPDNNIPLKYSWEFDGLAPNIYESASPVGGTVTFNNPGVFDIALTVTDSLGAVDPTPSTRRITVLGSTTQPPIGTLNNIIISPPVDVTILPGQSVFFSGQASPINGTGPFQYVWNFDGAAPDSFLQTPGDITFPLPGQYFVQFFVVDSIGTVVGQPVSRTITVTDPSTVDARILSPLNSSSYEVGEPVNLVGQVDNINGFTAINYSWRIRKVGGPTVFESNQLSPGSFTFTQAGEYRIKFSVTGIDAFGNRTIDSDARSRITVTDPLLVNNAAIAFPAQDIFVTAGQFVTFQPVTVNGTNLRYEWHFGGAAVPSFQQTPSPVQFNLPGTYVVTLEINGTDFNGSAVDLYGERLVTVINAPTPVPPITQPPITQPPINGNATPEGFIISPSSNISVKVGSPILFTASGFDPVGTGPLTFIWNFGGQAVNIISQNPGTVTFNRVGTYIVTLQVKNSLGQFDPTPATVQVTVTP